MKNLIKITLFFLLLSINIFSQEVKEHKQDLYILFSNNEKNKCFKNDSIIVRTFNIDYGKFTDSSGKIIELKIDSNNNLEKINWIRGSTSTPPKIIFYYSSNEVHREKRLKVNIKDINNFLEEDEIIKYVDFNNLKEILNEFNIYAVQKEGEDYYYAYLVKYAIQ